MDLKHLRNTALSMVTGSALLVALAVAPALADTPMDQNVTQQSADVSVHSSDQDTSLRKAQAYSNNSGLVNANSAAGNLNKQTNVTFIDTDPTFAFTGRFTQHGSGDYSNSNNVNSASVRDNAFNFNNGIVSDNAAAGNLNKQVNGAVLGYGSLKSSDVAITQSVVGGHYTSTPALGLTPPLGSNDARATANAFNNNTGEVASNIAAGDGNMQANVLVVTPGSLSSYKTSLDQSISGGTSLYTDVGNQVGPTNTARATDNSFSNNTGDVTSNIAAGDLNMQANSLTISGKELGTYTVVVNQSTTGTLVGGARINDATADANAFTFNRGNVSSNIAAGNGNQQANIVHINP